MQRFCLALDLKPDPALIVEYEAYHQAVWPEVLEALKTAGVLHLEIYRTGTRMFMILETTNEFSFEKKKQLDAENPRVQDWETLMWRYQQAVPTAAPGEKWVLMDRIFQL